MYRNNLHRLCSHSAQSRIDMRELEVSDSQAPRLPADDPVHPLLGTRVVVTHGPHKGYDGYIKDVRNTTISVKLCVLYVLESAWVRIVWQRAVDRSDKREGDASSQGKMRTLRLRD